MSKLHLLLALMPKGAPAARTFTFVGSCISNGTSLDFSALSAGSVSAGDILVYIDQAVNGATTIPTAVTPSGFTNQINTSFGALSLYGRGMLSLKKAAGGEGVITGMNDTNMQKVGLVFRPSTSFTSIVANDIATELTAGNPASQNCDPSAETVATIVLGVAACDAATAAFSTASPAFDGTVSVADSDMIAGYKIYNTSPAAHTIDMNDLNTSNWLASLYLTVS